MRKSNLFTFRSIQANNNFYVRQLNYVRIEVTINSNDTLKFLVIKNEGENIFTLNNIKSNDMKKVMNNLVEIFSPINYMERFSVEYKNYQY